MPASTRHRRRRFQWLIPAACSLACANFNSIQQTIGQSSNKVCTIPRPLLESLVATNGKMFCFMVEDVLELFFCWFTRFLDPVLGNRKAVSILRMFMYL